MPKTFKLPGYPITGIGVTNINRLKRGESLMDAGVIVSTIGAILFLTGIAVYRSFTNFVGADKFEDAPDQIQEGITRGAAHFVVVNELLDKYNGGNE